jgi:hypothetical protein
LAAAGEEVVCMLPHDAQQAPLQPVLLRASLKSRAKLPSPPQHFSCTDAALAAASGKLYLLGGWYDGPPGGMDDPSRLEVFEPHTGVWYTASSPVPAQSSLVGHAFVSNRAEGLLLALGGTAQVMSPQTGRHVAAPGDVWDSGMVAKYDIREGTCQCSSDQCSSLSHTTMGS